MKNLYTVLHLLIIRLSASPEAALPPVPAAFPPPDGKTASVDKSILFPRNHPSKKPPYGRLPAANVYSRNALTAFQSAACFFMNAIASAACCCWRATCSGLVPP